MEAIYQAGGSLDLIITLRDEKARKKSGRIYVDDFASGHGVPVLKINHVNDPEVQDALREYGIDWLFIIGWSQIASAEVISVPRKGVIGAHPTLLPEGRGRAAVPWAIIKGLPKTGVTFFKMDEGVDTGPILGQKEIPIAPDETATVLYDKVNHAHVDLIREIWPSLEKDLVVEIPQDGSKATYWEGRTPADGELRPGMTVGEVDRLVRATTRPYPGAFIALEAGETIIWSGRIGRHDDASFVLEFSDGAYSVLDSELRS